MPRFPYSPYSYYNNSYYNNGFKYANNIPNKIQLKNNCVEPENTNCKRKTFSR